MMGKRNAGGLFPLLILGGLLFLLYPAAAWLLHSGGEQGSPPYGRTAKEQTIRRSEAVCRTLCPFATLRITASPADNYTDAGLMAASPENNDTDAGRGTLRRFWWVERTADDGCETYLAWDAESGALCQLSQAFLRGGQAHPALAPWDDDAPPTPESAVAAGRRLLGASPVLSAGKGAQWRPVGPARVHPDGAYFVYFRSPRGTANIGVAASRVELTVRFGYNAAVVGGPPPASLR